MENTESGSYDNGFMTIILRRKELRIYQVKEEDSDNIPEKQDLKEVLLNLSFKEIAKVPSILVMKITNN